jgi:hypothetical protein
MIFENINKIIVEETLIAHEVVIVSPFIQSNQLLELTSKFSKNLSLFDVYVNWDYESILKGVNDLGIFDIITENGGRLFNCKRLHAKLYIFDFVKIFFGSANLTKNGFGWPNNGNIEVLSNCILDPQGIKNILETINKNSEIINRKSFDKIKEKCEELKGKFIYEKLPDLVFINDECAIFPPFESPEKLYQIHLFKYETNLNTVDHNEENELKKFSILKKYSKEEFFWLLKKEIIKSPCFKEIIDSVGARLNYWAIDDIVIKYFNLDSGLRKIVTHNFIVWISTLYPDNFRYSVGRRSEALHLIKKIY